MFLICAEFSSFKAAKVNAADRSGSFSSATLPPASVAVRMGGMIVVRIHGWRDGDSWAKPSRWYAKDFASRLGMYTDLQAPERELLARRVLLDRDAFEIPLAKAKDRYDALSIRSFLDSFGADTSVEEPNPAPESGG